MGWRQRVEGRADAVVHVVERVRVGYHARRAHRAADRAQSAPLAPGEERGRVAVVVVANGAGIEGGSAERHRWHASYTEDEDASDAATG
jgi:hypothetical protein